MTRASLSNTVCHASRRSDAFRRAAPPAKGWRLRRSQIPTIYSSIVDCMAPQIFLLFFNITAHRSIT
ncbi:MAG: hypothetical protein GPOALKHO_000472 [Sodalis sp.]|nr:MAG: hypothetical protein GPOALKHO_000472 [Sodalis sp.]